MKHSPTEVQRSWIAMDSRVIVRVRTLRSEPIVGGRCHASIDRDDDTSSYRCHSFRRSINLVLTNDTHSPWDTLCQLDLYWFWRQLSPQSHREVTPLSSHYQAQALLSLQTPIRFGLAHFIREMHLILFHSNDNGIPSQMFKRSHSLDSACRNLR